jgi:hypothetical protein
MDPDAQPDGRPRAADHDDPQDAAVREDAAAAFQAFILSQAKTNKED